jgi:hypothetical protein
MSPVLHGLYMGDSPVIPEYKLLLVMLEDGAARLDIGRDQVMGLGPASVVTAVLGWVGL